MSDYETLTKQSILNAAVEAEEMQLFSMLRPTLKVDGNQWCCLYGDDLQSGIAGFGDTPRKAVWDWNAQWDKSTKDHP